MKRRNTLAGHLVREMGEMGSRPKRGSRWLVLRDIFSLVQRHCEAVTKKTQWGNAKNLVGLMEGEVQEKWEKEETRRWVGGWALCTYRGESEGGGSMLCSGYRTLMAWSLATVVCLCSCQESHTEKAKTKGQ